MTLWDATHLLICKIHQLKDLFRKVFDTDDPILRKQRLIYCIRYHQEIIGMANKLNELNRKVLGQMSFVAAISMGFIATQIVETFSFGAVLHLLGFFLLVLLTCLIGQEMQDETYNIQDSINESKWDDDLNLAKDLNIVLMRCQKPLYLQSSPTGIFNYQQLILVSSAKWHS
ncbi:unnamed protein product [Ceutorhynchus assimilis]|uniref:Odorant receptor n=1 Tax=Ceutorhynchus assimilis TaxID=467358 RepID=A0A9N9QP48_9CUCU|nr:unnamed protein product [Ceutorhynchus assimilis]